MNANFLPARRAAEIATQFDLTVTANFCFGNSFIALDGRRQRIVVIDTSDYIRLPLLIDFSKAATVSIRKEYKRIDAGALRNRRIDDFIEKIFLHFEFDKSENNVAVCCFDRRVHGTDDVQELEKKLRKWQIMISKMIHPKKTAAVMIA